MTKQPVYTWEGKDRPGWEGYPECLVDLTEYLLATEDEDGEREKCFEEMNGSFIPFPAKFSSCRPVYSERIAW